MSDKETITRIVDESVSKMMEHCDAVSVLVSFRDGGEGTTASYEKGGGNFYARLGQIVEWLNIQQQYHRNYAIKKDAEDPNNG